LEFNTLPLPIPIPSSNDVSVIPIEVDVETVSQWRTDPSEWVLIDCREENEFELASIAGAMLLPMSQWKEVSGKLQELINKHIVVHCHHGGRSMRVASWMRANGFPTAQSMAGGIDEWSKSIDHSVPRY